MSKLRYHVKEQLRAGWPWSVLYRTDDIDAARVMLRSRLTNPYLTGLEIWDTQNGEIVGSEQYCTGGKGVENE